MDNNGVRCAAQGSMENTNSSPRMFKLKKIHTFHSFIG